MLSAEDMKTYDKISSVTHISLIKISSAYKTVHKFVEAKVQFTISKLWIKHVLRRTLSPELVRYTDSSNNVYEGFNKICKHYEKDTKFATIPSRRKLKNIKLHDLNTHIKIFKKCLAQYKIYVGQEDEGVLEDFIRDITDAIFHAQKSMFTGNKLDEMFSYFEAIEANLSLRSNNVLK
eukprot:snap_masked-scaffold_42-processed-gene-2.19-mRNA-1 protein AED:1.00 eAED:1.00 QI:0/0/0/0/1/1/2/0/177